MEEKSRRGPPREYGAETVRFECGCIQRRCERKHKGSVAPREERKNASRLRACSTTPLQSILRPKVGAKRWLVPPSRFPPTVSIFTSFSSFVNRSFKFPTCRRKFLVIEKIYLVGKIEWYSTFEFRYLLAIISIKMWPHKIESRNEITILWLQNASCF